MFKFGTIWHKLAPFEYAISTVKLGSLKLYLKYNIRNLKNFFIYLKKYLGQIFKTL